MSFDDTQNNVIYSENGKYKVTAYGEVIFGDDEGDKYSLSDGLIELDVDGRPSEPVLVLSSRGGNKIGAIQNVRSINITHPLSDVAELSFDVYKEINGVTYGDWDKIKDFKFIQMPHDNSWFEAKVTLDEENDIVKHVACIHANEAELGQLNLYDVEINTDADIERDDYVETFFYNEDNPNASLLHRILKDKAPHYQIYHVDDSLKGLWRSFSFSGTSIQDALNQIAEEVGCLFVYGEWFENDGKYHRTISAYDLEDYCYTCGKRGNYTEHVCTNCGSTNIKYGYGEDTGIFISKENLATSINYESNTDEVKNCFRLVAGDDVMTAAIKSCNPSMSQYMWHFSDDMLEDMSQELRNKITAYQTLVNDYQTTTTMDIGRTYVNNYNTLVNKYTDYDDELERIDYPIVGTSKLTEAYYNAVNLYGFIKSELMPSSEKVESTTALEQLEILQENGNMDEVGISSVSGTIPYTSANSAIQSFAKVYIDTSRYKVTVLTNDIVGTEWTGTIVIESYTDDEDTASDTFTITLFDSTNNEKYVDWINQSVQKAMANREVTDLSVTNLFDKDETLASFKEKIKGYSLDYLDIMNSMATSAITIMTEQGVANENSVDTDVYTQLYKPYLDKSRAIQDEIAVKETELSYLQRPIDEDGNTDPRFPEFGLLDVIVEAQNSLAKTLDVHTYLGDELWTELSFYRREDEYQNTNYISDGLTDGEIIEQAQRFIESATKEIIKSSTLQHTISAPLIDFLIMPEFMKLQKKFKTGNWIHLMVDGKVYKLRLTNWTVDFDNIEDLDVEFSDVVRTGGSVSDIASILSKSRSMATTYDYTAKQANKGKDASDTIKIYRDYGIDFRKIKAITSKGNTNIVYDDDGILLKRVDGTETLPEQARIYNNGIYITKDAWETVSTGLGHYSYVDPETGETVQTYGIIADTVIGKLILGENLKIYSESGKFEMGDSGLKITAKGDTGNSDLFVVQKEKQDDQGRTYVEKYIYVDSNGEVKISGSSIVLGGKPIIEYIDDAISDADIDVSSVIAVQVDSSAGTIFKTNNISSTFTATIYKGGKDVTSDITEFKWTRRDKDGNIDTSWTRITTTNSINVSINNLDEKTIIDCEVVVENESEDTTAHGSITIIKLRDGSQFWTTTTAPTSPDYTFTVSNLIGDTNADVGVGDIIYYSHYRYTVMSVSANGTTVLGGDRTNLKGVDGISPAVKSIDCSDFVVVKQENGSYSPETITFKGKSQNGDEISDYLGWFVIEASSDATNWTRVYQTASAQKESSAQLNISSITAVSDVRFIRCSLYSSSSFVSSNLIDQQDVAIVSNGTNGRDGTDGVPGKDGKDGTNSYVHIKYSSVANPTDSQMTETPSEYIGICTNDEIADPTTASSYTWSKWMGVDGTDGIPGTNGRDGTSTYVHFAYANSADGQTDFSTTPFTGAKYIGVRTDTTQADSMNPTDYEWSEFKGEKGDRGASITAVVEYYAVTSTTDVPPDSAFTPNVQSPTATSPYLWNYEQVRYSDGTTNNMGKHILMTYNQGDEGRGIASVTEYYALSNSTTAPSDSEFTNTVKTVSSTNKYLWNYEVISYTDGINPTTTDKRIIGVYGDKGDDAYTVILTNGNHTFAGGTRNAVAANVDCGVIAYKGTTQVSCHIGSITGFPTGMTARVTVNDSTSATFRVSVTTAMNSRNGILNVPVTVDSKIFNLQFTYSLQLNGLDSTGLGWMVNHSSLTQQSNGKCYYHGFDVATKEPSDSANTNAWVMWNGEEVSIPMGCYVNPVQTMPFNTTIYSVYRRSGSTGVFHDVAWVESLNEWQYNTYTNGVASANSGSWTWNEGTDIILAMYVVPSNGGAITNAQLFTPPKKYSELVEVAKGMAKDAEKVANYYMVTEPSTGTMIADMSDGVQRLPSTVNDRRNILLTDTEIKIRDGQDVLASYGNTVVLGKNTSKNVTIDTNGVAINNGTTRLASYGDNIVLGEVGTNKKNIYISPQGGLDIRNNTTSLANFSDTVRIGKTGQTNMQITSDQVEMTAPNGSTAMVVSYEPITDFSDNTDYGIHITDEHDQSYISLLPSSDGEEFDGSLELTSVMESYTFSCNDGNSMYFGNSGFVITGEDDGWLYNIDPLGNVTVGYQKSPFIYEDVQEIVSYSAGTIGTRAAAISLGAAAKSGYRYVGATVLHHSNSSSFWINLVRNANNGNVYANIYRASTSAVDAVSITVRKMWVHTKVSSEAE